MPAKSTVAGSFRDPSGFVFKRGDTIYRQVNLSFKEDYDLLMKSGLYAELVADELLIPHKAVKQPAAAPRLAYKVIQPEQVEFISFPYEWSFSQLKDAALATLAIQKRALAYDLWLKDANAKNIQFHRGKPVLIDSLSLERYPVGQPWVAYRQFCRQFLAPLALMAYCDIRLSQLSRIYIDGVELSLASRLLPARTRLNLGLLTHIHLHAQAEVRYAGQRVEVSPQRSVSRTALLGLVDHLERTVAGLRWQPGGTAWGDYYEETNYTDRSARQKEKLVADFIRKAKPKTVWDLGANTGRYSRIASKQGIFTLAADIDPTAVEAGYLQMRSKREKNLHPLLLDLTNPSAALGWANEEMPSLAQRGPAGLVMALALVHHLAIRNNVPLERVAAYFAGLSPWLIIEFVPKSDSQVQILLAARKDIFDQYHVAGFRSAFQQHYRIVAERPIAGSERTLFLMKRK